MKIQLVGKVSDRYANAIAIIAGIREAGHECIPIDPGTDAGVEALRDDVDLTIVMKRPKKVTRRLYDLTHTVALWMPDELRMENRQGWIKDSDWATIHFTYDDSSIPIYIEEGVKEGDVYFVPLSGNPNVYQPVPYSMRPGSIGAPEIDFVFVGTMQGYRHRLVNDLKLMGYNVEVVSEWDGESVNYLYQNAKVVLNHAHPVGQPFGKGYGLQQRLWEAGLAGRQILTNELMEGSSDLGLPLNFFSEHNLREKAEAAIERALYEYSYSQESYRELYWSYVDLFRKWNTYKIRIQQIESIMREREDG